MRPDDFLPITLSLLLACSGPGAADEAAAHALTPEEQRAAMNAETLRELGALSAATRARLESAVVVRDPSEPASPPTVGPWVRTPLIDALGASGVAPVMSRDAGAVVLRIADLEDVVDQLVPAAAELLGIDDGIDIPSARLASGRLGCWRFRVSHEHRVKVPVTASGISATVHDDRGRVDTRWSVPGADVRSTVTLVNEKVDTTGWCRLAPRLAVDLSLTARLDGVDAELDATLATRGNRLDLSRIDHLAVDLGPITLTSERDSTGLVSWLVERTALSLFDLFDRVCSGVSSCIEDLANTVVERSPEVRDALASAVNEALDAPLRLSGSAPSGSSLSYAVALDGLDSEDTADILWSTWDLEVDAAAAVAACASGLTFVHRAVTTPTTRRTSSDLELELPVDLIGEALAIELRDRWPCAAVPVGPLSLRVRPAGRLTVSVSDTGVGAAVVATVPFAARPTMGSGGFTGTLEVHAELVLDECASTLSVQVTDLVVVSLEGEIIVAGVTVDGADHVTTLDTALGTLLPTPMAPTVLVPGVTEVGALGDVVVALVASVVHDDYLLLGLDLTARSCGASTGGGGGGGGGGGPGLPDPELTDLDPRDEETLEPESPFGP